MKFVIYHQAPGGPKLYHVDARCSLSKEPKYAVVYGNRYTTREDMVGQVKIIRNNFEHVFSTAGTEKWSAHVDYKNAEHWMGCGLEEIKTETESLK